MGCYQGKVSYAKKFNNMLLLGHNFSSEALNNEDEEELRLNNWQFVKISAIKLAYEITSGSIVPGRTHAITKLKKEKHKADKKEQSKDQELNGSKLERSKAKSEVKNKSFSEQQERDCQNSANQLQQGVFEILEDDYLQELSCNIGERIEQLDLKTYRGNSISFGKKNKGRVFEVRLSKETFGPFASNSELNSLRIRVLPVPETFLNEING